MINNVINEAIKELEDIGICLGYKSEFKMHVEVSDYLPIDTIACTLKKDGKNIVYINSRLFKDERVKLLSEDKLKSLILYILTHEAFHHVFRDCNTLKKLKISSPIVFERSIENKINKLTSNNLLRYIKESFIIKNIEIGRDIFNILFKKEDIFLYEKIKIRKLLLLSKFIILEYLVNINKERPESKLYLMSWFKKKLREKYTLNEINSIIPIKRLFNKSIKELTKKKLIYSITTEKMLIRNRTIYNECVSLERYKVPKIIEFKVTKKGVYYFYNILSKKIKSEEI